MPIQCRCIVFPPRRPNDVDEMDVGICMRCKGKPCNNNFSQPSTGRLASPTQNLPCGVMVGQIPSVLAEQRSAPCVTFAMASAPRARCCTDCHSNRCLAQVNPAMEPTLENAGTPDLLVAWAAACRKKFCTVGWVLGSMRWRTCCVTGARAALRQRLTKSTMSPTFRDTTASRRNSRK